MHALDLVRLRSDGHEAVGEHIHWDGRYAFNQELQSSDIATD